MLSGEACGAGASALSEHLGLHPGARRPGRNVGAGRRQQCVAMQVLAFFFGKKQRSRSGRGSLIVPWSAMWCGQFFSGPRGGWGGSPEPLACRQLLDVPLSRCEVIPTLSAACPLPPGQGGGALHMPCHVPSATGLHGASTPRQVAELADIVSKARSLRCAANEHNAHCPGRLPPPAPLAVSNPTDASEKRPPLRRRTPSGWFLHIC